MDEPMKQRGRPPKAKPDMNPEADSELGLLADKLAELKKLKGLIKILLEKVQEKL